MHLGVRDSDSSTASVTDGCDMLCWIMGSRTRQQSLPEAGCSGEEMWRGGGKDEIAKSV
jgi:hypothetical protein